MSVARIRKVYAFITRADRLLVFRHVDHPQAGIQVPGGTVEAGESYAAALWREVGEETGLFGLAFGGLVGRQRIAIPSGEGAVLHLRRFYHLRLDAEPLERWRHVEEHASDGSGPLVFEFWWADLAAPPRLEGQQDACLAALRRRLKIK